MSMSDYDSDNESQDNGEEKRIFRKVIEWRTSETMDDEELPEEEEDIDSAYSSELASSTELSLSKNKVPPLHLVPGEKYDCSISTILSPLSFRLRMKDEEFYKLTRLGGLSIMSRIVVLNTFGDFLNTLKSPQKCTL